MGTSFSARPERPCGPPSLLYNGYRVFPGGKVQPGRAADHSPPSSARGHGRVELYLYPPSGAHRACNGITLPFTFTFIQGYPDFKKQCTTRQDEVNERNCWSSYGTEDCPKMANPHGFSAGCYTAQPIYRTCGRV